jgi:hypothetical protein
MNGLEGRREANVGRQVDNGALVAGSPMHYYCRSCGTHVATLPEDWWQDPPPRYCQACLMLPEAERTSYDEWLKAHGHRPVPR